MSTVPAIAATGRTLAPRWPLGTTGAVLLTVGLLTAHFVLLFGVGGALARALRLDDFIGGASPASFVMLVVLAALEVGILFRRAAGRPAAGRG